MPVVLVFAADIVATILAWWILAAIPLTAVIVAVGAQGLRPRRHTHEVRLLTSLRRVQAERHQALTISSRWTSPRPALYADADGAPGPG